MKIAIFVRNFPALSETFVLNQITGLIDLGHAVDIYALGSKKENKVHSDVVKYNLLDHTTYVDIPPARSARVIRAASALIRKFHKNPKVYFNALNPFKDLIRIASLKPLLMASYFDKPYDVLHCHFGPIGQMGMLLKYIDAPIKKYVTTFHAADLTVFFNSNPTSAYAELFNAGDLMLPISYRWKDKLTQLGCDPDKIKVHRMGVDCERFTHKKRTPSENGIIKLLSVARLTEKKGIAYSIRAIGSLVRDFPEIEYNIAGDGPLKDELAELVNELDLNDNVHLLGQQAQDEVQKLLDASHVFLAPSVTAQNGDQEGIPVALMEAMAMGLPVISTHHSGIPELIEDKASGLLVPERDEAALAEAIAYLISDPGKWDQYGQRGRKRIEEEYQIDALNKQLETIFIELTGTVLD